MLYFDRRVYFAAAARAFAGDGFKYWWRAEFPLIQDSLDYVNEQFSRFSAPVLQRKNRRTGRSELFIPETSRDYAAVCCDPKYNALCVIALSRDPIPMLRDVSLNPTVEIGQPFHLKKQEMMMRQENGRMEPRELLTISVSRHMVECYAHAALRAIETDDIPVFQIFHRLLDETFCLAPQKYSRVLPMYLLKAWQKAFHENPPESMAFSGAPAPDFRESLLSARSREDFPACIEEARAAIAGEREILQRFFERNPAESYKCDIPALTCGHGALGKGFVSAYNSFFKNRTRDPAEDPELLESMIGNIRKKSLPEAESEELIPEEEEYADNSAETD